MLTPEAAERVLDRMRTLALLLAISLPGAFDTAKLAHTYTKGDKTKYAVKIESTASALLIEADVEENILSETKDGITESELKSPKVNISLNGATQSDDPASSKAKLDARGVPDVLEVKDQQAPLAIFRLVSMLPNQEVEVGKKFKVEWKSESVGDYVANSTLKEIKEVEGQKRWILESEITFTPHGDREGILKLTSTFDPTGRLVKCVGTISLENMVYDLTIDLKK